MHYTGQVYRPPLEAYTPLLEVTYGCSHNACAFCTMYYNTKIRIIPLDHIESDIMEIRDTYPHPIERIYLLNGDRCILPTERPGCLSYLSGKPGPNPSLESTKKTGKFT